MRNVLKREFSQDGWLLPESIGTLLFYLIMFAGVVAAIFVLFSGSKVTQMEQGLTQMNMQIQGLYANASSYSGINNDFVIKAGAAPAAMTKGSSLVSPWGGNITVAPGQDNSTFTIKIDSIKRADCTKLAVYQLSLWTEVAVNGSTFKDDASVTDVVNACVGSSNSITYTSR